MTTSSREIAGRRQLSTCIVMVWLLVAATACGPSEGEGSGSAASGGGPVAGSGGAGGSAASGGASSTGAGASAGAGGSTGGGSPAESCGTLGGTGVTWLVAPDGADSGSCGATDAPCATVQYVLDNLVAAGDTIKLEAGTYDESGFVLDDPSKHSGVTVTADDTDDRPYFPDASVEIAEGVTDVTISHLRIRGGAEGWDDYWGLIVVRGYPTNVTDNELWNGGQGVLVFTCREVCIANNVIHDLGLPDTEYDTHGIAIANFQSNPSPTTWAEGLRILGNTVYNCGGDGIQDGSAQVGQPSADYMTIANNTFHHNSEQGIDMKGPSYLDIRGNDVYENVYGGISTNDSDGNENYQHHYWWIHGNVIHDHINYGLMSQEGDDGHWYVWNNIFYGNGREPWWNTFAVTDLPPSSVVEHNVFWNNNRSGGAEAGGISTRDSTSIIRNNVFFDNGLGSSGNIDSSAGQGVVEYNYVYPTSPGITGDHAVTGSNPGFVSLSAPYDFRLLDDSPARDAGMVLTADGLYTIDLDLVGAPRGQGVGWDLGAYEHP
jgi:parallel beta-helix repeat protein